MGLYVLVHEDNLLIDNVNPVNVIDDHAIDYQSQKCRNEPVLVNLFKILVVSQYSP